MFMLPVLPTVARSEEGCQHRLVLDVPYGAQTIKIFMSSCQEGRVRGQAPAEASRLLAAGVPASDAQAILQSFADGSSLCDVIYARSEHVIPRHEAAAAEETFSHLRTQEGGGYFIPSRERTRRRLQFEIDMLAATAHLLAIIALRQAERSPIDGWELEIASPFGGLTVGNDRP